MDVTVPSSAWSLLSAEAGMMALRVLLIAGACILLFLLLFTVRDILIRTRSFVYQLVCIALVALLPVVGFLIYLLIRPARTVRQRETDALLAQFFAEQESVPAVSAPEASEESAEAELDASADEPQNTPSTSSSSPTSHE